MGKISPFGILGETFANAFRWIHVFVPIALVTAVVGAALNAMFVESLMPIQAAADAPPALPENFGKIWAVMALALVAMQTVQLSLFDAVMEGRSGWLSFGLGRAVRRFFPTLIGMILFAVAYVAGAFLFVIPGLMVLFLLYMMMPLILLDGVNPFAAVKKSWNLTWGNGWRLVAAVMLTFVPVMLVFWMAAIGITGISFIDPAAQAALSWSDWQTWAWIAMSCAMNVILASFYLVAFKALKAAKPGDDEPAAEPVAA